MRNGAHPNRNKTGSVHIPHKGSDNFEALLVARNTLGIEWLVDFRVGNGGKPAPLKTLLTTESGSPGWGLGS